MSASRLSQTAVHSLPRQSGDAVRAAPPPAPKRHLLTIALEDYYHTTPFKRLVDRANWYRFETRLEVGTLRALDLLDQFGARATFFALGWVADAAPELIRKIASRGHEIATRGYYHRALRDFDPSEFRDDVLRAREALQRASGQPVVGYRVAQGWLAPGDLWALRALAELHFAYDSSIKPILRDWSNEPWRRFVHRQEFDGNGLWEIPLSSARLFGFHIPIAGGNYFRQWPHWIVRSAVARWDRECAAPFVMYFHTWELDPAQPKFTGAPMYARVRQYRNLERMPAIIGDYLSKYRFTSVAESLNLHLEQTAVAPRVRPTIAASAQRASADGAPRTPVTIVVPCYNEAATLPYLWNTLRSVRASLAGRYDVRVILVDDASVDGTWDVLTTLFGAEPDTQCYRHPENQGVAAAITTGIRHATTPIVCSIDCDCTYDPHELGAMIPLLTDTVDVVTASPYHPAGTVRNVPEWRLLLSRTASRLYRIVFRHQLYTYTSCFRVYRRSAVVDVRVNRGGFIGVVEMLGRLELAGARITEYPTTLEARLMGHSKMKVVRTAIGHLALMARLAGLRAARAQSGRPQPRAGPVSATPSNICIVGGGILGMTLARRLQADGARVTIVEGASRAGGLTTPSTFGGFTWDRFYHVILRTDSLLIGLVRELGLEDRLRWAPTRTGFYIDGRLHSLSSSLDFVLFPALSPIDKLRLAATVIRAARVRDWRPLEAIRATTWLRRWSGHRTVERIWLPLLRAKLGANAEQASAAFIWAIIARLYGARRSSMKRESFGYVEGGYATILSRLEADLEAAGIQRRFGARVTQVTGDQDGVTLSLQGNGSLRFDAVVLTVPCGQVSALCSQLTDAEHARLEGVTYQGIVCTSLLLKQPLAGYYVTNITDAWVPFTAVVEMTTLVDRSNFGGNSLVYLPRYVTQDDQLWQQDDASIERAFVAALERMYPHFRPEDVVAWQVSRVREMLAVSTVGYSQHLAPPVQTTIPNVFVVNSAQIVNGTLNVNETLGLAETKLPELRRHLQAGAAVRQMHVGAP